MKRQFSACQTSRSMYFSIFKSFRVIRCLSQCVSPKIAIFTSFLFLLGTLLWQSRKTLHKWKDNSVLAKPLAACTHLSPTVSQLFEPQVQKIAVFTAAHFFVSPGDAPATITQYVPWMERQFNACQPSQHVPIYLEYFPSYTMLTSMRTSKNCFFYHILVSLGGRPWGNHAKCCMHGKKIRCLQIVSLHVLI